ncbi:hypothetical protein SNE40_012228 [Patella caerulea]|uniref:Uncharacterized protein n=1 Tax=Patella caerulea TaxID=87958 RepID=A0AAN8JLD5_PATCE
MKIVLIIVAVIVNECINFTTATCDVDKQLTECTPFADAMGSKATLDGRCKAWQGLGDCLKRLDCFTGDKKGVYDSVTVLCGNYNPKSGNNPSDHQTKPSGTKNNPSSGATTIVTNVSSVLFLTVFAAYKNYS